MTAAGNALAGMAATAAMVRSVAPLAAVKPLDQSVTNSVTLVNDNDLALALPAAGTYLIVCIPLFTMDTTATAGVIVSFTGPSWSLGAARTGTGGTVLDYRTSGSFAGVSLTSGGSGSILIAGTATATAPVTLQMKWAQQAASTTASVMKAGSVLAGWQIL